ncbi:MAG: hypothetical protein CMC08_01590 [Flavobacteriaceae bacterium]|nr:hypothetical protein [Flavobacteriaceae bacterium]
MARNYIEMRQPRDIGDIISVYFEFFKLNLKNYLNIFVTYNGLFILGFIGVSYLLVTGFMGTIQMNENASIMGQGSDETFVYIGLGALGFFILFVMTAILNYSLAASYMVVYDSEKTHKIEKTTVWALIKQQAGNIFVFIVLMILIYVGIFILGVILSIVPLVGTLAFYLLLMAYTAWMGLSFMCMLMEKKHVTDALGEGWHLLFKFFWKSVLVNLVVGILVGLLLMLVLTVPAVLLGIYAYFSVESGAALDTSPFSKILWTLGLAILMVVYSLNQSLQQFINGVLYFSLHEELYNDHARAKIDQIGSGE